MLKELSHLPVIVDPSHAAGRRDLVEPLSLAAAAAGADGIIVEVHPEPDEAICDGPQQLRADEFAEYADKVERAAAIVGKELSNTRCVKIAVLGVGLIGGSIGLAARERLGAEVAGFDPADGVLAAALERGAVDTAAADLPARPWPARRRRSWARRSARCPRPWPPCSRPRATTAS